jgi:hypothetical protein
MPLNAALLNQQSFSQSDGNQAIDTILTQEANRIGQDIHRRTLHVSPWMDLIKQTSFPDGMGYTLGTLIYDRALPVTAANGSTLGTNWIDVGQYNLAGTPTSSAQDQLQTGSTLDQVLIGARDSNIGAGTNNTFGKSFISFGRQLKQYSLKRATVESPRINVEDLRFAAYRTEQLRAVMDALTDATRYSWEERYRDEYDRICANLVSCLASGTAIRTTDAIGVSVEGKSTSELDLIDTDNDPSIVPSANISNKILDSIYFRLVRAGAGTNAYGRENARPVFALVCSSEASYALQTEAGFRDDVRYNNAKVSELIAPLGIEKSFRGFYHLIDDLAPRYSITTGSGTGVVTRVPPYTASNGVVTPNLAYETATYEAAYILHQDVMESQIPEPISGSNGLTFDPVNYRGKFAWKNIPSIDLNPDGTVGFFRGVLASASKPIKTEFGYVILFQRTSTVPAA